MLRDLGFRGLGFRFGVLGFRGLGVLGSRSLGLTGLGFRVSGVEMRKLE